MRKFFSGIVVVLLLLMGTVWSAGKEPEAVQTIGNKAARLVAGEGMLRLMEQELMEQSQAHPEVALTFDDGPSPKYTPLLLDGLKERNVRATFFLLGKNVKENQELVQRMQAEGHLLGNHTYNHVQLNKIPETTARQEILKTNNEIYEATGKYPEYMRPPYGAWKKNMELCVEMLPVFWDIDTLDWKSQNVDAILKAAGEEPEDGSIILMHDEYQTSVEAALLIIDRLKEKGYEFVTVDELIVP
ncbi:peptidoglycan N-acetylglucosamine deacetylase [Blautia sp. OM07-19]|mgnify:FL=1|jgi:peptidoglycan/xylan/chitin deacetylase (PgdA/CDA1 family)|uniref:polysaccharide deacetylase family protein n=1 Tax=unclassified Blautia TaxID=2648079 RepID=UPI000E555175|nr:MULTISPECIES: polysaccharide deacetylase family protein [unclassified Blautia]RGG63012.1 peptidoglycan N-acetylglucosamine deacetylase [Blautia sp. AF19-10LB]RHV04003.1 peptidoglycan N-acetylglucosamine deacetylase [Blautia sp. OM07-19]